MLITENELRRVIREVLLENFRDEQLNEDWRRNLAMGLSAAAPLVAPHEAKAEDDIKSFSNKEIENLIYNVSGINFNYAINEMVKKYLKEYFDEDGKIKGDGSGLKKIVNKVIVPWLKKIKGMRDNEEYYNEITGFTGKFYYDIRIDLEKRIEDYLKESTEQTRSGEVIHRDDHTISFLSPEDLKRWNSLLPGDTEGQEEILSKYR